METPGWCLLWVSPDVEYVSCVPPMVCGLQLLAAIRFSLFNLGRGVRERLVYHSPLPGPGVGKPAMVVVRVQGPPAPCICRTVDDHGVVTTPVPMSSSRG
jgi:hypothetical protein